MCGFVAVIGEGAEARVVQALDRMKYRGTRIGYTTDNLGRFCMGHVRLPIVGLSVENDQPTTVMNDTSIMAFVGEVLDFREDDPGMDCDLTLVKRLWEDRGPKALFDRDGFWSIAVFDQIRRRLHLVTDYLSQKPIYYRADGQLIAAASEIDQIAIMAPVTPDYVYLSAVMKWGYCPEITRTPYMEIRKMLPGSHLVISDDGIKGGMTVDGVHGIQSDPSDLRGAIEYATEIRAKSSDVPVACLVSGGLDSSIVYTLAERHADVHAIHVENGEWEYAKKFLISTQGEALIDFTYVPREDLEEVDDETAVDYMQEPLDLGSLVPQIAVAKVIDDKFDVCLTGDGADESFGGYSRAKRYDSQASDVFHELVGWHLPRLDRVMMRHAIEVRSPFLSRHVIGRALGLPRQQRIDKAILREIFRDDLPREVVEGAKRALRTQEIEEDREGRSVRLVNEFMGRFVQ